MAHLDRTLAHIAATHRQGNVIPEWRLVAKRRDRDERVRLAIDTIAASGFSEEPSDGQRIEA